jgi:glycosyltransferase involved in cell wall biosynthesis
MSRLRVCEVVKTLDVGGAEILLVERLRLAPKTGRDYTVVCLRASTSELIDRLHANGVAVVDLSSCPWPLGYARLVMTVRRLSPGIVNVHSPITGIVLRPFIRFGRRRPCVVSTVHSVAFRRATMLLDRLTRGLDDQTVAVSPIVARSPTVRGARRVATCVHGVDVSTQRFWAARADALRLEFGVPEGAFLLVSVANFRPVKNHRLLIRAAAQVLRTRADAVLLLAGDGPLRENVVRDVRRLGLTGRVRLLGRVPEAKRLVAAADLLVLSSHHEGLPVVGMEALAAGVPVVSTAVGGVPDLITSGRNGILTEPGSPDALAVGILQAMDPAVHRRLRDGAARTAETIDMAATVEWFDNLYDELAVSARRRRTPVPRREDAMHNR